MMRDSLEGHLVPEGHALARGRRRRPIGHSSIAARAGHAPAQDEHGDDGAQRQVGLCEDGGEGVQRRQRQRAQALAQRVRIQDLRHVVAARQHAHLGRHRSKDRAYGLGFLMHLYSTLSQPQKPIRHSAVWDRGHYTLVPDKLVSPCTAAAGAANQFVRTNACSTVDTKQLSPP